MNRRDVHLSLELLRASVDRTSPILVIVGLLLAVLLLSSASPAATLDIIVYNTGTRPWSNAKVILYSASWSPLQTKYTDSYGKVYFSGLSYATYHYEVYYNGTGTEEFWGSDENISLQSSTVKRYFHRQWPWISADSFSS